MSPCVCLIKGRECIPSFRGRESTTTTENDASESELLISVHASNKTLSTTDDLNDQLLMLMHKDKGSYVPGKSDDGRSWPDLFSSGICNHLICETDPDFEIRIDSLDQVVFLLPR